jgi:acylphosphatase
MTDRIRYEVHYSGRVQGVGFRWTAVRIAGGLDVTGFVRNLGDGRVQLVAEGSAAELDRLLAELRAAMGANIRDEHIDRSVAMGSFHAFSIQH